jgi:hypothetical protein
MYSPYTLTGFGAAGSRQEAFNFAILAFFPAMSFCISAIFAFVAVS